MLDVGCNAGYNCIHAAKKYGLSCTGIDVVPPYIESARFLSETAGINAKLFIASAETFSRPEEFDVALHFGTLYHLPNPVLSLRTTFDNLRPGGYLALETQVYDHPEDSNICYFMHMQNNDRDQLLGDEQQRADKVFGIGWLPRNSTVEAGACRRSRQTHGANHLGRTETRKTVCSTLRSAAYR